MSNDGMGWIIRRQDPLVLSVSDVRGNGLDGEIASGDVVKQLESHATPAKVVDGARGHPLHGGR
eukprot:11317868-Heterocapsa_arctica.AAC.1